MIDTSELLKEAQGHESLYNAIGNVLYKDFEIQSAEVNLIILHTILSLSK